MPTGRPTDYTPEKAAKICGLVSSTFKSVKTICEENDDLPDEKTAFVWMHKFPSFRQDYLDAKETQGILYAEEILDRAVQCPAISEEIQKQAHVFRVAQWHFAKMAPKQFGDKKQVDTNMKLEVVNPADALAQLD